VKKLLIFIISLWMGQIYCMPRSVKFYNATPFDAFFHVTFRKSHLGQCPSENSFKVVAGDVHKIEYDTRDAECLVDALKANLFANDSQSMQGEKKLQPFTTISFKTGLGGFYRDYAVIGRLLGDPDKEYRITPIFID